MNLGNLNLLLHVIFTGELTAAMMTSAAGVVLVYVDYNDAWRGLQQFAPSFVRYWSMATRYTTFIPANCNNHLLINVMRSDDDIDNCLKRTLMVLILTESSVSEGLTPIDISDSVIVLGRMVCIGSERLPA